MGLPGLPPSWEVWWSGQESLGLPNGHPSPQTQVMEEIFEICGNQSPGILFPIVKNP